MNEHGEAPGAPHGGALVDLLAGGARIAELGRAARDWPSWDLTPRQLCDLELLLSGGFSPLRGFLGRADYESVCAAMRLRDGTLWPIPVTLDVTPEAADRLRDGGPLALRDPEGVLLAVMHVEELWQPDRRAEAEAVLGTTSAAHPGVSHLTERTHPWYVAGPVEGVQPPVHHDFRSLRPTPADVRREIARRAWRKVVAFQTRNPIHRAHAEMALRAARETGAGLLIHPAVGMTRPGDVDHYARVRCYRAVLPRFPPGTLLALLPLAMRMAGPREALWHAIIRKNHGCTHFIVGRDHAGPGADADGRPFYGPYDAQELLRRHESELGVTMVPFREMVYLQESDRHVPVDEVPAGAAFRRLSGTELGRRLAAGGDIPEWFAFPEVVRELRKTAPPRARQGFTVFFTGLSGAGKSTLANLLLVKLLEMGGRAVSLLDGDVVRRSLSSELGFSREHRDINIRRIGFVAAEITKCGGVALCAPIAPFDRARREARAIVAPGGFVLVHVATPLDVCEQRDRKGLYAKARAGLIPEFTGVSSPYEPPGDAEVVVDCATLTPEAAVDEILGYLRREGYVDE